MTKIGGENYINHSYKLGSFQNETYYSSGQSALIVILRTLLSENYSKIYIPNFICDSVINVCKSLKFNIINYEIDDKSFEPVWNNIDLEENTIFYLVSYYGFVETNSSVLKLKSKYHNIITISDRVQDYYNINKSLADFSFNSFRKFLPIPEGSIIVNRTNLSLLEPEKNNSWSRLKYLAAIMKLLKFNDKIYLRIFNKAEYKLLNTLEPMYMSRLGVNYFNLFHHYKIKLKREENYKFVYDYGKSLGIDFVFKYEAGLTPIAIPVKVNSSKKLKKNLFEKKCYLNSYWPSNINKSKFSQYIYNHSINIIINHTVNLDKIKRQIMLISKFNQIE
jgi:hypothetical protein